MNERRATGPNTALVHVLACLVLALSAPSDAGTIGIGVETRASLTADALVVTLGIGNSGDEAAASVVPAVRFAGAEVRGERRESLGPGERMEPVLRIPFSAASGQWPLVVTVDYADANGYPFQAVQVALVSAPGASPAMVVLVDVEEVHLADTATIRGRLKSLSDQPRRVDFRFVAPRGLDVAPATQALDLEPWADAVFEARLINRAALPGSRYPVFATVEYDDAGEHHAAVGHGMVEVRAPSERRAWVPLAAAGGLIAVWIGALALRRRRATKTAA